MSQRSERNLHSGRKPHPPKAKAAISPLERQRRAQMAWTAFVGLAVLVALIQQMRTGQSAPAPVTVTEWSIPGTQTQSTSAPTRQPASAAIQQPKNSD